MYSVILKVTSLQTTVDEQVEEVQSKLEKKDEIVKELDSQVKGILQDGQWIMINWITLYLPIPVAVNGISSLP